jgi:ABC-type multidrug transport system ATPase subunit
MDSWRTRESVNTWALMRPCSDEPTNHLDAAAIRWLGNFLKQSGGTLIIVSHDEALLEDACDHIAEVCSGQRTCTDTYVWITGV